MGEFPGGALRFFNWGAFSQPLLWGVVYGVWPVVGATLLAGSIPYFVLLTMGAEQALSASTQFGVMAISGVLAAIVRIWSGMVANERAWNRESAVVLGVLAGKPRRTIGWYVERQVLWTRIGMVALLVATGAAAYMDYGVLEPAGAALAYYVVVQHFIWLGASVLGAAWIVKQEGLSQVLSVEAPVTARQIEGVDNRSQEGSQDEGGGLPLPGSEEIEAVIEQFHHVLGISEPGASTGQGARSIQLANGVKMPVPGFGTYKVEAGDQAVSAVRSALHSGYRNIDTASFYQNERSVGLAIRESGLNRSDVFISSKMWNDEQGYSGTLKAFDRTVSQLGVQHLDLYLIHWPVQSTLEATWRALEHLYAAGRVSAIGVCNFDVHHLEQLMKTATITPMVNQVELHPRFQRMELAQHCKERGIAIQAWAPLMRGGVFNIGELVEIGRRHGKTAGQVALQWSIQEGYCPLPKSTDPARIAQNGAVLDFWLSPAEMEVVRGLDRGERVGPDPDLFSWNWPESTR